VLAAWEWRHQVLHVFTEHLHPGEHFVFLAQVFFAQGGQALGPATQQFEPAVQRPMAVAIGSQQIPGCSGFADER